MVGWAIDRLRELGHRRAGRRRPVHRLGRDRAGHRARGAAGAGARGRARSDGRARPGPSATVGTGSRVHAARRATRRAALPELDGTVGPGRRQPAVHPADGVGVRDARGRATTTRSSRCGPAPDGLDVIRVARARRARGCCGPAAGSSSSTPTCRAAAVPRMLPEQGGWAEVGDHRDLTGRPRFVTARKDGQPDDRPVSDSGAAWRLTVSRRFDCADPDAARAGLREAARAAPPRRAGRAAHRHRLRASAPTRSRRAASTALLAAKGRGRDMPVPVLVGVAAHARTAWSPASRRRRASWSRRSGRAGSRSWPGTQPSLAWDLGDADGTVARADAAAPGRHRAARRRSARWRSAQRQPVRPSRRPRPPPRRRTSSATPSRSTSTAARRSTACRRTIVDLTGDAPRLLREGALTFDEIAKVASNLTR